MNLYSESERMKDLVGRIMESPNAENVELALTLAYMDGVWDTTQNLIEIKNREWEQYQRTAQKALAHRKEEAA